MYWNYRIVTNKDRTSYGIREIYYEDGGIKLWTERNIPAYGDNLEELKKDLEYMLEAFRKPALVEDSNSLYETE